MVNEAEAANVRALFQRFLSVGSMTKLVVALRSEGMRTKGGKPVDKGYIYRIPVVDSCVWRRVLPHFQPSRGSQGHKRTRRGRCL